MAMSETHLLCRSSNTWQRLVGCKGSLKSLGSWVDIPVLGDVILAWKCIPVQCADRVCLARFYRGLYTRSHLKYFCAY